MKIMLFGIVLIICGVFKKNHCEILNCEFKDWDNYLCFVKSLDNSNNTMIMKGHSGTHLQNKTDSNVEGIWVQDTNTKYIPSNLGLSFNLTSLTMHRTQLVEIKSQDFNGMQNLQFLGLANNRLSWIPIDVFSTLTKLKDINLTFNLIEEIRNGVFANNLQLEKVYLFKNQIKFLGSSLFDGLTKLVYVVLWDNICTKKEYKGSIAIIKLKKRISLKCKSPYEPATQQDLIYMQERITKLEAKILKENKKVQKLEKENEELEAKLSQQRWKNQMEQDEHRNTKKEFVAAEGDFCSCEK